MTVQDSGSWMEIVPWSDPARTLEEQNLKTENTNQTSDQNVSHSINRKQNGIRRGGFSIRKLKPNITSGSDRVCPIFHNLNIIVY
ncbi:uncharacterized protein [Scyliorhinus torazame]|uniref:uncharacterized protein isoform X4 n=1 Tax=Scyliorhinus torazame TaxID=75743 RepID=UPI003B5AFB23